MENKRRALNGQAPILGAGVFNETDNGDYVEIDGVPLLKTSFFQNTLDPLPEFSGFFPRFTVPKTVINQYNETSSVDPDARSITALLLIIDTKKEINVGMAPHFPPVVLNTSEIMMNSETFEYMEVDVDD